MSSCVLVASASTVGTESSNGVSSGGGNYPFAVIHNNDEIGKSFTMVKLNDANYLVWYKSIKVVLRAEKLKFLLEDLLPEMVADYEDWMSADAYVMSWLWHR